MTQDDWAAVLTASVGRNIKECRRSMKISALVLSDKCAEIGMPIPRDVIANLENGRRSSIGVAEVIVLAEALGVPPLALIYSPLRAGEEISRLPTEAALTKDAIRRFAEDGASQPGEVATILRLVTDLDEAEQQAIRFMDLSRDEYQKAAAKPLVRSSESGFTRIGMALSFDEDYWSAAVRATLEVFRLRGCLDDAGAETWAIPERLAPLYLEIESQAAWEAKQ